MTWEISSPADSAMPEATWVTSCPSESWLRTPLRADWARSGSIPSLPMVSARAGFWLTPAMMSLMFMSFPLGLDGYHCRTFPTST